MLRELQREFELHTPHMYFELREIRLYGFTFAYEGNLGMYLFEIPPSEKAMALNKLSTNIGNIRLFSVYSHRNALILR